MFNDSIRHYSLGDIVFHHFNEALNIIWGEVYAKRIYPPERNNIQDSRDTDALLTLKDKKKSAALIRVNHSGEICAQALYEGQKLIATSPETKLALTQAALEEKDHLAWCLERLKELDARPSYLNPLWYTSSFILGVVFGLPGEGYNLGFVAAIENQVERHLQEHLKQLPSKDKRSLVILEQMIEDEQKHACSAIEGGAQLLPLWVEKIMFWMAQPMRKLSYWI